jgi:hypothetical protein
MPPFLVRPFHITFCPFAGKRLFWSRIVVSPEPIWYESPADSMTTLLLHWIISAASLIVVAYIFPGIRLQGIGPAIIAPLVVGLVNATLGFFIKTSDPAAYGSYARDLLACY